MTTRRRSTRLFPASVPASARAYISGVIVLGVVLSAHSLYAALAMAPSAWLLLLAATVVSSWFAVKIPLGRIRGESISVTLSDTFIFAAILLFSAEVAVLVAVTEALVGGFRVKIQHLYKRLFNVAQLAVAAFVAGWTFDLLGKSALLSTLEATQEIGKVLFLALVSSVSYFVLNSTILGGAVSLVSHQFFLSLWRDHFLWLSPSIIANGAAAAVGILYFRAADLLLLAAVIPLVLTLYYAQRTSLKLLRQAQREQV